MTRCLASKQGLQRQTEEEWDKTAGHPRTRTTPMVASEDSRRHCRDHVPRQIDAELTNHGMVGMVPYHSKKICQWFRLASGRAAKSGCSRRREEPRKKRHQIRKRERENPPISHRMVGTAKLDIGSSQKKQAFKCASRRRWRAFCRL